MKGYRRLRQMLEYVGARAITRKKEAGNPELAERNRALRAEALERVMINRLNWRAVQAAGSFRQARFANLQQRKSEMGYSFSHP